MDIERLVVTMLDAIEEADDTDADGVVFRFNKDQIEEIAEAYREVEEIEIY
jgi:hypothetical protein